jgi:hypothetical protein
MTAETVTEWSARVSTLLATGLAAVVVTLAAAMIPLGFLTHGETGWASAEQIAQYLPLAAVGFLVARSQPGNPIVVALPVGIAIAILKYRLYDIDRITSQTLAYTIITVVLAALYAGLVLLATEVLDLTSQVAVAAATLAAAALFSPLRRRVERAVDRRFNRARYDADNTIVAFAARLQDATDPDAVRSGLIGTVQLALEPAQVSLWPTGGPR